MIARTTDLTAAATLGAMEGATVGTKEGAKVGASVVAGVLSVEMTSFSWMAVKTTAATTPM